MEKAALNALRAAIVAAALLLNACATYQPQPLPTGPDLENRVPRLKIDVRQLPLPMLRSHPFNPENGLDMTEAAVLAVINNPDLKARRYKAGIAGAQLFNARLLPDPQVSLSGAHPTTGPSPLSNAYGIGLNYDIITLVTRGAGIDAAQAAVRQVDLDILWQEWLTVQQARTLFVQSVLQASKLALLRDAQTLYANRYARSYQALQAGNLTLDVTGTDLTALLDANTKLNKMAQSVNQTRHDFNLLLGLQPEVALDLTPQPAPQPLQRTNLQQTLAELPRRRPDLLALQAGYLSQEEKVRRAILSQFPSLNIGLNRGRDTGDVTSTGIGITFNLPVLNANRGEIAIQRATREQLAQAYQARLDQALTQINLLQTQYELVSRERSTLNEYLPVLERMVAKASQAYEAGNIPSLTYVNMANTLLSKRLENVDLEQSLWQIRINLDTLLAWPEETSGRDLGESEP
jgi:cobalt-zinc-cadmium efflux system outer membrane protein